jgi:hypothetical protein
MSLYSLYVSNMNFFRISSAKRLLYVSSLQVSFVFYVYIVRRHAYVSDQCSKSFLLLMVYSHSETKENPAPQKLKVI